MSEFLILTVLGENKSLKYKNPYNPCLRQEQNKKGIDDSNYQMSIKLKGNIRCNELAWSLKVRHTIPVSIHTKNTRGMGEGEVVDELWQISMQLEDQIICMLLLTSAGGSARTNCNVILQNLEAFKPFGNNEILVQKVINGLLYT